MTDYKLVLESTVDELAQFIRKVDGNHKMGAGALAEKICERFRVDTPAVQGEPVGFCEDAALSIAERTFSTDVDEQLASDIIQYAQRLHSLYAAPQPAEQQPAPDVEALVTLLEHAQCNTCDGSGALYDGHGQVRQCQWCHERSEALAAHRKGGEE